MKNWATVKVDGLEHDVLVVDFGAQLFRLIARHSAETSHCIVLWAEKGKTVSDRTISIASNGKAGARKRCVELFAQYLMENAGILAEMES